MYKTFLSVALVGVLYHADVGYSETADEQVECAEKQKLVEHWDNGNRSQIVEIYGEYAESVVKTARFVLHMRIKDTEAPNGWRYHCPPEYHTAD